MASTHLLGFDKSLYFNWVGSTQGRLQEFCLGVIKKF